MYQLAILFAILGVSQAQFINTGSCNFTLLEYHEPAANSSDLQNYYEIRRISNTWNAGQCSSWQIASSNNSLYIRSREIVSRRVVERNATGVPNSDRSFNVSFEDFKSNFAVLGLGEDFAVLYACSNQGSDKLEYAWVLSSNRTMSESAGNVTQSILNKNNLGNASWVDVSHSSEACRNGASKLQISSVIVLVVGFVMLKGL